MSNGQNTFPSPACIPPFALFTDPTVRLPNENPAIARTAGVIFTPEHGIIKKSIVHDFGAEPASAEAGPVCREAHAHMPGAP